MPGPGLHAKATQGMPGQLSVSNFRFAMAAHLFHKQSRLRLQAYFKPFICRGQKGPVKKRHGPPRSLPCCWATLTTLTMQLACCSAHDVVLSDTSLPILGQPVTCGFGKEDRELAGSEVPCILRISGQGSKDDRHRPDSNRTSGATFATSSHRNPSPALLESKVYPARPACQCPSRQVLKRLLESRVPGSMG